MISNIRKEKNGVKKALKWLDNHLEEMLMCFFLMGVVLFMFLNVFYRYVLKESNVWAEEITRFLFIWMVFVGLSYGVKHNSHLRVSIIETFFPKITPYLHVIQDAVVLAFVVYLIPAGCSALEKVIETGQKSDAILLPMIYVYSSFFVGQILTIFRILEKWFLALKQKANKRKENI